MKKILSKFILIFFVFFQFESFAEEKNYHKELITDWSRIFPDQIEMQLDRSFLNIL